jgi:hypothetical protein
MAKSLTVEHPVPAYESGAALLKAEAGRMFVELDKLSFIEVAYKFGLDRYFSTEGSMRSAVMRSVNLVLDNPSSYDVSKEKAEAIHMIIQARNVNKATKPETIRAQKELAEQDITKMITGSRDLVTRLLRKKLEYLDRNPKALKEEKIRDIAWVVGVLFDKGQIVSGQATEHIAVLSSINDKLNPDEALKAIMEMREQFNLKK